MTAENKTELSHAEQNAEGWSETICELVAALQCDYDRLEELEDERAALVDEVEIERDDDEVNEGLEAKAALAAWDEENGEELAGLIKEATYEGERMTAESARERIEESPLSVRVRGGWRAPGAEDEGPEEFEILLSTGGPALRIMGDLNQHCEPTRAYMQHQDWGTPWTDWFGIDSDTLLAFCGCFYFGE